MPLLEIITRTYKRPTLLAANEASLRAFTSRDWMQTKLIDETGRGVAWANVRLSAYVPEGRYVWVLDDDDICIRPTLVDELEEIATLNAPDVILMRMDHGPLGVLPDAGQWGHRKVERGRIGVSSFIVARGVWQAFAGCWREQYDGDFDFIAAVLADKSVRIYWHDVVASRVQRISRGLPE
jgi:hypothetical protein